MKISTKMSEAINKQINKELYSGYLYLSMSTYFASNNLSGLYNQCAVLFLGRNISQNIKQMVPEFLN